MPASPTAVETARPPHLVWVLVPEAETTDPNLAYYYDFTESRSEYARAFDALGIDWRWQPITLATRDAVIARMVAESDGCTPIVLNLCDGDEVNGVPGLSVIHALDATALPYTGADAHFYDRTTSKIVMKGDFERAGVPTSPWAEVSSRTPNLSAVFRRLGRPLIVKPAVSAGSMGIGCRSVVHGVRELRAQLAVLDEGYRGWDVANGGIFVERFIAGREFTVFIIGSAAHPDQRIVYPAVERVFHHALPATERFLSFDRLWEFYEVEPSLGAGEYLWEYAPAPADLQAEIQRVSWAAYAAVGGTGYGRVDLRRDDATGRLCVLEVNAQCGLSEDENSTSIGAILRFAETPYAEAVRAILDDAVRVRSGRVAARAAA
ncbi:MAG: hypothetical protein MUF00_12465 [Gemmatimonadaceae bacterium]|jgi:D-alanine-D-alanine ligase|nr:hypothetical protein [Gemmatimonadaceae bacterium]